MDTILPQIDGDVIKLKSKFIPFEFGWHMLVSSICCIYRRIYCGYANGPHHKTYSFQFGNFENKTQQIVWKTTHVEEQNVIT